MRVCVVVRDLSNLNGEERVPNYFYWFLWKALFRDRTICISLS